MLVVCILASALGALVMCLLVLRYGFMPILETNPARAYRDLLVTRLGHEAAGVCFATSAILAVVYIARAPVQPAAATPDPRGIARPPRGRRRHRCASPSCGLRCVRRSGAWPCPSPSARRRARHLPPSPSRPDR